MRILLIGYGRMGNAIEKVALERGHQIVGAIDESNPDTLLNFSALNTDVAIEFSTPDTAEANIGYCIENHIPVISGTTGWTDSLPEIAEKTDSIGGTFLHSSNFSIGVNIFFKINELLAKLMNSRSEYNLEMEEIHHIHKLDKPSGTAITLAEGVINNNNDINGWVLGESKMSDDLSIKSTREGEVPGTHTLTYSSDVDEIKIRHKARSRDGFALGAILVADWIINQKGFLTMNDFMNDQMKS